MTRTSTAAAALVLLLAGCPLPQPLPEYPPGSVTPPRILMDGLTPRETVIRVPAGCAVAPSWELAAALVDTNTAETVTARWFVDYDPRNSARCAPAAPQTVIEGPGDGVPDPTQRLVPPYRFRPYDHAAVLGGGSHPAAAGVVHVVELVVSNRFDAAADLTELCAPGLEAATPFRTAVRDGTVQFETQTYRWIFVSEAPSDDIPCPQAP